MTLVLDLDVFELVKRELSERGVPEEAIEVILLGQNSPGYSIANDLELHDGQKLLVSLRGPHDASR